MRTLSSLVVILLAVPLAGAERTDQRIDLAEFGRVVQFVGDTPETLQVKELERASWEGWEPYRGPDGQPTLGLEFDEPRDLVEVGVEFRHAIAQRHLIQVQYFQQNWPSTEQGGWAKLDDPFHGKWVTAKVRWWAGDRDVRFAFLPYNQEQPGPKAPAYTFRRTYRLRFLLGNRELPPVRYLHAFGPQPYADGRFDVQFDAGSAIRVPLDLVVNNGFFLEGKNLEPALETHYDDVPVSMAVRYARNDLETPTRTIVTLRNANTRDRGVSFLPEEAARYGSIRVPALGVTITHRGSTPEPGSPALPPASQPVNAPGASIYDRVATQPEQTWERARRELPELDARQAKRYIPLGPPEARQELAVCYDGSIRWDSSAFKVPADDGKPGTGHMTIRLRTGSPPVDPGTADTLKQQRLDGYLPVVLTKWETNGVAYEETCVATYLNGEPPSPRGDETVVLLARLKATNAATEARHAEIQLARQRDDKATAWPPAADKLKENLLLQGGLVTVAGGARDSAADTLLFVKGDGWKLKQSPDDREDVVTWSSELPAGQSQTVEWFVPYWLAKAPEQALAALDFDKALAFETDRWRRIVEQAAVIETPEPLLNDFYKSSLVNLLITADRDPFNGMWVLPAGTFNYGVCLNESCIQALALEQRGLYPEAQRCLDSMLTGQSARGLQGRFTDAKGVLLGLPTKTGDYQTFNYSLDHGFALWMLNQHYRYSRDRAWLERVAPAMIEACDFITRQANAPPDSNTLSRDDRYWGVGLLPPGHLEDPPEWLWWFAVNAWAWRGMNATAESLREINHAHAARITRDAGTFGDTLRASCREAMIRAPVVRLRDGTYVPFQPTRSRLRGRDLGWIRDALYGPIQLIDCGVWPADSPEAEWILRDAEDNVFIGGARGYELKDFDLQWFSWGGMTLQPNLLPVPMAYLARDMRKHALRGFYNTLAASVYADAGCFAEWVKYPGTAGGPLFKPPDESAFITWMRNLLVVERGPDLNLLAGAPTAWLTGGKTITLRRAATWFGPLDMTVRSDPATKELSIDLTGPQRNPPQWVRIYAGAPGKIARAVLDGKPLTTFDANTGIIELPGASAKGKLIVAY